MSSPDPARPSLFARSRSWSLQRRTWLLLCLLAVSLVGFVTLQTRVEHASVRRAGAARAEELAAVQAGDLATTVSEIAKDLDALSADPTIRNLTRDQCRKTNLDSGGATLNIVDRAGHVVCSSIPAYKPTGPGPDLAPYRNSSWIHDRAQTVSWHYTPRAPLSDGATMQVVRPAGRNLLVVPFDRGVAHVALHRPDTSAGQQVTLADAAGHVILTNPDVADIGDPVAYTRQVAGQPLVGSAPVAGTSWRVYVTLDWAKATAAAGPQLRNLYLAAGVTFLFALLLALAVQRFVLRPLGRLESAMRTAADGRDVRADPGGPTELAALAGHFNSALDAREEARSQLAEALGQLVSVREDEKRTLALALHDNTIQSLVAARWFLEKLAGTAGIEPAPQEDVDALRASLDGAIDALRHETFELMPLALEISGLVPAIQRFLGVLEDKHGLATTFEHQVDQRLPREVETLTFRTIQEALRNVVKHADARHVWVRMVLHGDQLDVEVRDDGSGFSADRLRESSRRQHLGVVSMRETIALAGGRFTLDSTGRGTVAAFTLPLATQPA